MLKTLARAPAMLAMFIAAAPVFSAHAQEAREAAARKFPRVEMFLGFSYLNATLGSQSSVFVPDGRDYAGIQATPKLNLHRNIGLLMDMSPAFAGTRLVPPFGSDTDFTLETYHLLFGPEVTLRRAKFNAFAHALAGKAFTTLTLAKNSCSSVYDICPDFSVYHPRNLAHQSNLVLGFGGGVDINWKRHWAIRLFQADYIPARVDGKWEKGFRASTGLILKF